MLTLVLPEKNDYYTLKRLSITLPFYFQGRKMINRYDSNSGICPRNQLHFQLLTRINIDKNLRLCLILF